MGQRLLHRGRPTSRFTLRAAGAGVDPSLGLLAHNSLIAVPLLSGCIAAAAAARGADEQLGFLVPARYGAGLLATLAATNALGVALNYTMSRPAARPAGCIWGRALPLTFLTLLQSLMQTRARRRAGT